MDERNKLDISEKVSETEEGKFFFNTFGCCPKCGSIKVIDSPKKDYNYHCINCGTDYNPF
jgi:uncharacterized protein (DUF983 family)